jgi:hypothetical protein
MTTTQEVKQFEIVKIKSVKSEKYNKYIGLYGVDTTPDYYGVGEETPEYVLTLINNKDKHINFFRNEVELEVVGYVKNEPREVVPWENVNALSDFPHTFTLENTGQQAVLAGNVSRTPDLRMIQLTDKFVMGYTTTLVNDEFNQQTARRTTYPNSDIYYFIKIGEMDGKMIIRYFSDMVVSDERESIDWVLGTGEFKVDTNVLKKEKVTRIKQRNV